MSNPIEGKHVFLTGGAGFIGSTLIGRLVENNRITVYDNLRRDSLKDRPWRDHENLTLIEGDVLDLPRLREAMAGAQVVVHCAAVAGIATVGKRPTETMRINMMGTAFVLEAAQELGELERLVDFSTSEVFGPSAFRVSESDMTHIGPVGEPRWTYAVSKLAGEHLTKAYHQEFGMPTATVRPFNVYGPGQVGEGALRIFIERALAGEEILIHGDGNQIRAWTYVDDFVDALELCLWKPEAVGESFNIGNARAAVSVRGLAEAVIRVTESSSSIRHVEAAQADIHLRNPEVDVRHVEAAQADIHLRVPEVSKARKLLGFEAQVDLEEGIRRTAESIRARAD